MPCLLFRKSKYLPPIIGTLSTITVEKSSLGLQFPVTSENEKYPSSLHAISKLIGAVTGASAFQPSTNFWRSGKKFVIPEKDDANGVKLKE